LTTTVSAEASFGLLIINIEVSRIAKAMSWSSLFIFVYDCV
jgi:hypothetical protein